jgi:cullin 1
LTSAVLHLIKRQRNGDAIDERPIKAVLDSFVSIGLNNANPSQVCFDFYEQHFEALFLDATETYYRQIAMSFLAEHTISEYLRMVKERLREEEDRAERYLHPGTRESPVRICERILICDCSELICASFPSLLEHGTQQDLQRMYSLLWRIRAVSAVMYQWLDELEDIQSFSFLSGIPEAAEYAQQRFQKYVTEAGLSAIAKLAAHSGTNIDELDPSAYVNILVEIYQENLDIVNMTFGGGVDFTASLQIACSEFVNHNVVTGTTSAYSSRLLAKYVDIVLRNNGKRAEEDIEGLLNHVVCTLQSTDHGDHWLRLS